MRAVPLLAVAVLALSTGLEILPPDAIAAKVTPARVAILFGLVALFAYGTRLGDLRTRFDIYIGLLLFAGIITTIEGGPSASLRYLLTAIALYYLAVGVLRREVDGAGALGLVALIAVVGAAAVGVAQIAQDTPTGFFRDGLTPVAAAADAQRPELQARAVGTFANPNLLSAYVLLFAPLAAVAALRAPTRGTRIVLLGAVAVAYLGLVLTFSRAALVAVALGGLAGVAFHPRVSIFWRRRIVLLGGGFGVVLLIGMATVGDRLASGFGRPEAWSLAWRVAIDHLPFGVGLGGAGGAMSALPAAHGSSYAHAHNLWLTWFADAGILGLAAMVALTVALLWSAARRAREGSRWALGALVGLVGFFVVSVVDDPANAERVGLAVWLVAAFVAVEMRFSWEEPRERQPAPAEEVTELAEPPMPIDQPPVAPLGGRRPISRRERAERLDELLRRKEQERLEEWERSGSPSG